MKQKPWDRYEAALLLSYCLKIEAGDIPRKEAVDIVSNTLADKQTACPLNGSGRAGAFSAMRPVI